MSTFVDRTIDLITPFGGRVPPATVASALSALVPAAISTTFMAIEGRGRVKGRATKWAQNVADIRFHGASPSDGKMVLRFSAPKLIDAAPDLFRQRDFWRGAPPENSTALDFLAGAIDDVSTEKKDSDRFDANVLHDFKRFGRVLRLDQTQLNISGTNNNVVLDESFSDHVRALTSSTPSSAPVRVVGSLDMLRASTQSFGLLLADGSEIRGFLEDGDIADLRPFLSKEILVSGRLVYRPSGKPLRIDSARVSIAGDEADIWRKLPQPPRNAIRKADYRKAQSEKTGILAIIGGWPGDESDDEIFAALETIS